MAITFDTELIWALRDEVITEDDLVAARNTREAGLPAILSLLSQFDLPCTFAVVGHMLVHPRELDLPDVLHESSSLLGARREHWYQTIGQDFARYEDGLYWPDILQLIREANTIHEIACHTFTHCHFEAPTTTPEIAHAELALFGQVLQASGEKATSVVFPRNAPGHTEVLGEHGYTAYRGLDRTWWSRAPKLLRPPAHMADRLLAMAPPCYGAIASRDGLRDIPGSMLFWGAKGVRRRVPMASRVAQARRGVSIAARKGKLFHLWMHPIDIGPDVNWMTDGLSRVFEAIAQARDAGAVDVRTMRDIT